MYGVIGDLAVGAVGGLVAYLLAQWRFVSERAWERRYELYGEIFDVLHQLENSLVIFEHSLEGNWHEGHRSEIREASISYNAGLRRLNQLQERLMLLGAEEAHVKLMVTYAALGIVDPTMVMERPQGESELQEVHELIRDSRRMAAGRNGEFAFLARRDLGLEPWRLIRWWRRRKTLSRMARSNKSLEGVAGAGGPVL
jgi:hypothetical protein